MAQGHMEDAVQILVDQETADKTGHRSAYWDLLPSSELHLLMVPQDSQIVSSAREQTFKT